MLTSVVARVRKISPVTVTWLLIVVVTGCIVWSVVHPVRPVQDVIVVKVVPPPPAVPGLPTTNTWSVRPAAIP
jgi:hypothetical protein